MTTPLAGLVEEEERLEGGARGLAALRLLLASLAIAVTLTLRVATEGTEAAAQLFGVHPVYTVAVAACIVDVVYLFALRHARAARRLALLVAAGLGADILMTSTLVYLTRGYASPYLPLLFVWVIAAGAVLSGRAAFGAASLVVVCLSSALILRHFSVYPGDGLERPAEVGGLWQAGAFHLAQSGAFFIVAYLAGVLSRHLAAAQLLADEVMASLHEGLLVLDRYGRVSFANRRAARLLGVELPRRAAMEEALSGERLPPARALLASQRRFGPVLVELPGVVEGGEPLTLAISGTAVRSPRGAFRGLIAVISDRSAERALSAARRLAEQRRQLGELAMSIAHEIRNPLGAIRSAVQEIGREPALSATGKELADVVLAESDRLDRIVGDFLTFARPKPPALTTVRLRNLVADAQEIAARSIPPGKAVEVVNEVDAGTICLADADQLRQALLNLDLNAIAAIDGAGRVRVSARPMGRAEFLSALPADRRARLSAVAPMDWGASRPGLVLEVADNGTGMDPEALRRAGEPFFTRRAGGTGLGLAIVERIASAHGGAVNVTSEPGAGTTVQIWLPAAATLRPRSAKPATQGEEESSSLRSTSRERTGNGG